MSHVQEHAADHQGTRRDFLYYATAGAGVVATGAAVWPLVNQMNPSADVQRLSSIRVDVSAVAPGTQLTVLWQGKPVFIRSRTEEEVKSARDTDLAVLVDRAAENENTAAGAEATDANRTVMPFGVTDPKDNPGTWYVSLGVCTHLGCVPLDHQGDFGGWFCPCHGSHYDTAGRIRKGPAPKNLHIPLVAFVDDTTIKLG